MSGLQIETRDTTELRQREGRGGCGGGEGGGGSGARRGGGRGRRRRGRGGGLPMGEKGYYYKQSGVFVRQKSGRALHVGLA